MGDMMKYSAHIFRANWQKEQFDNIKTKMPPQSAVRVMDFAMNYQGANCSEKMVASDASGHLKLLAPKEL